MEKLQWRTPPVFPRLAVITLLVMSETGIARERAFQPDAHPYDRHSFRQDAGRDHFAGSNPAPDELLECPHIGKRRKFVVLIKPFLGIGPARAHLDTGMIGEGTEVFPPPDDEQMRLAFDQLLQFFVLG